MSNLAEAVQGVVLRRLMNLPPKTLRRLAGEPVVRDDQELAAETQLMLRMQERLKEPAVESLPIPEGREALLRQSRLVGGWQQIGQVRELQVSGAAGALRARLYIPSALVGQRHRPTLLFLHGGGMIYGGLDSHDAPCRFLAERSRVQVLAVDYRLAPEHPYPAAVEDAVAAYRWLVEQPEEVQADPLRLAVGGDSAGGYLAAVVAQRAAREIWPMAMQMLIYPVTDFTRRTRSREEFGEGFFLTSEFIDLATESYFPPGADRSAPDASVLLGDIAPGTPPAIVATAGFDPLRDEGEAYADKLVAAGVEVEMTRYPSMIHGFFNVVGTGRESVAFNARTAGLVRHGMWG